MLFRSRIDPNRSDDIEAELQRVELGPIQPTAESSALKGKVFDVALSFAGEKRGFVREVYRFLSEDGGLYVFYDEKFEIELWGEDLDPRPAVQIALTSTPKAGIKSGDDLLKQTRHSLARRD